MFSAGNNPIPVKDRGDKGALCGACGHSHKMGNICSFAKGDIEEVDSEIEKGTGKFKGGGNPYHDPDTGRFTTSGSGKHSPISQPAGTAGAKEEPKTSPGKVLKKPEGKENPSAIPGHEFAFKPMPGESSDQLRQRQLEAGKQSHENLKREKVEEGQKWMESHGAPPKSQTPAQKLSQIGEKKVDWRKMFGPGPDQGPSKPQEPIQQLNVGGAGKIDVKDIYSAKSPEERGKLLQDWKNNNTQGKQWEEKLDRMDFEDSSPPSENPAKNVLQDQKNTAALGKPGTSKKKDVTPIGSVTPASHPDWANNLTDSVVQNNKASGRPAKEIATEVYNNVLNEAKSQGLPHLEANRMAEAQAMWAHDKLQGNPLRSIVQEPIGEKIPTIVPGMAPSSDTMLGMSKVPSPGQHTQQITPSMMIPGGSNPPPPTPPGGGPPTNPPGNNPPPQAGGFEAKPVQHPEIIKPPSQVDTNLNPKLLSLYGQGRAAGAGLGSPGATVDPTIGAVGSAHNLLKPQQDFDSYYQALNEWRQGRDVQRQTHQNRMFDLASRKQDLAEAKHGLALQRLQNRGKKGPAGGGIAGQGGAGPVKSPKGASPKGVGAVPATPSTPNQGPQGASPPPNPVSQINVGGPKGPGKQTGQFSGPKTYKDPNSAPTPEKPVEDALGGKTYVDPGAAPKPEQSDKEWRKESKQRKKEAADLQKPPEGKDIGGVEDDPKWNPPKEPYDLGLKPLNEGSNKPSDTIPSVGGSEQEKPFSNPKGMSGAEVLNQAKQRREAAESSSASDKSKPQESITKPQVKQEVITAEPKKDHAANLKKFAKDKFEGVNVTDHKGYFESAHEAGTHKDAKHAAGLMAMKNAIAEHRQKVSSKERSPEYDKKGNLKVLSRGRSAQNSIHALYDKAAKEKIPVKDIPNWIVSQAKGDENHPHKYIDPNFSVNKQSSATPKESSVATQHSSKFSDAVHEATGRVGEDGRLGGKKVYASEVHKELMNNPNFKGMDSNTFKQKLSEAVNSGEIEMSRADLVKFADPQKLKDSETRSGLSQFHYIHDPKAKSSWEKSMGNYKTLKSLNHINSGNKVNMLKSWVRR